jgi:hypothetical protein
VQSTEGDGGLYGTAAPCGSVAFAIQSPPRTSIGPVSIRPPFAAACTSGTPTEICQFGGTFAIAGGVAWSSTPMQGSRRPAPVLFAADLTAFFPFQALH